MYTDVVEYQCDPSGAVDVMDTCRNSGPAGKRRIGNYLTASSRVCNFHLTCALFNCKFRIVFGAMLGVAFAAQGMSQLANSIEALSSARSACAQAMMAIDRKLGTEETTVTKKVGAPKNDEEDLEETYTLPKYEIDSSSHHGLAPQDTEGEIKFENVKFAYPTRPDNLIFNGLDLTIPSGKTVALVGPSGGGKSTTVGLIERFYDPLAGSVKLDGVDMKELNVNYLRSQIGYVGQEPALFATTIENNIRYGKADATMEEIEEAAKRANAYDFISGFSDGFQTQVGDKGTQLSGGKNLFVYLKFCIVCSPSHSFHKQTMFIPGQKQRIAIARVLVGNPKILLLGTWTR